MQGVSAVVQGFAAQQKAAQQYAAALGTVQQAQAGGTVSQIAAAHKALGNLVQNQQAAAQVSAVTGAAAASAGAIGFLRAEIGLVKESVDQYAEYAGSIRTIQQLTGASLAQSEQFRNLSKVAGVGDQQAIREVLALSKDLQSGKGRGALAQLGITPGAGENELVTFQKVVGALSKMEDGVRKTNIELQLFGARGVKSLLPFLNLQGDIIAKTATFSANLDGGAIASIQHLQQNFGVLGLAIQNDFVIPIVQKILPAIEWMIDGVEGIIKVWHDLDATTHGALSWAAVLLGVGAGVVAIVTAVNNGVKAFKELQIAIKAAAAAQALLDLLEGPSGWAVLGVAGVGIAGGAYYLNNQSNSADGAGGTANKIDGAADKFGNAVDRFGEAAANAIKSWAGAGGGQIPSNFNEADYTFVRMRTAVGAIR